METRFQILSHACLLIERGSTKLVTDPWLIGSCYWRSWWNFPEHKVDDSLLSGVSKVFISHIHWDHWHGVTLKRYFRDCEVVISDEPNERSYENLKAIGVRRIARLPHGGSLDCGDGIRVSMYQFGKWMSDSCLVIETPELKLLNMNDAKMAGLPLRAVLSKYGHFDFALRSHSSANDRICFSVGGKGGDLDDRLHYSRAFKLFMDAVTPRFAIPFASNHCYLHRDVIDYNAYVTNPLRLQEDLTSLGGLAASELVIMPPGSSYSTRTGFHLQSLEPFRNFDREIQLYALRKAEVLAKYYREEERATISPAVFDSLIDQMKCIPSLLRRRVARLKVVFRLRFGDQQRSWHVLDCQDLTWLHLEREPHPRPGPIIDIPALVFRDAVLKKMFAHIGISKRVRYDCADLAELHLLWRFLAMLGLIEHRLFPLKIRYIHRVIHSYVRRWREVYVYAIAAYRHWLKGDPLWKVEERILLHSGVRLDRHDDAA